MNSNANYRNLCFGSSVGRGNDTIGTLGSPLSVRFPSKYCNVFNRFPDQNMRSTQDIAFSVPIDDERGILIEEMQNLSLNERESSRQTVLGHSANTVSILSRMAQEAEDSLIEERLFRERKFRELNEAIKEIEDAEDSASNPDFAAYRMARDKDPTYVNHPLFKIGFLRAEKYDAERAAVRLLRYLAEKLDLFGPDKLTLDIILDDIGDDGKRYLEVGGLHVLPMRDAAGRCVIFEIGGRNTSGKESDILSARKAYFYFWTSLAEDDNEEGRVKGVVGISWRIHNPPPPDPRCAEAIGKIWQCAPTRISAYHVCYGKWSPSNLFHLMFARMTLAWFKKSNVLRLRRAHYGTALDCMYTLLGEYDCPSQCFPLKCNEDPQMGFPFLNHHVDKWMIHREKVDNEKKAIINSFGGSRFSRFSLTGSVLSDFMSTGSYVSNTEHEDEFDADIDDILIGRKGPTGTITAALEQVQREDFGGNDDDDNNHSLENLLIDSIEVLPIAGNNMSQGSVASLQSMEESLSDDTVDTTMADEILDRTIPDETDTVERNEVLLDDNRNVLIRDCDTERHILKGRGRPLQRHPGNLWLQDLIRTRFDEYDTLERTMQTRLTEELYVTISSLGRRFLEKSEDHEGYWCEINRKMAREKLAISFRTERARRRTRARNPNLGG